MIIVEDVPMPLSQVEHIMRRVLRSGITIEVKEETDTFRVTMYPSGFPEATCTAVSFRLEDALLNCAAMAQRNDIM